MYNNLQVVKKKFSSPVTPILETKGHKTLLKELFMYYVSAEWGGGAFKLGVNEGVKEV